MDRVMIVDDEAPVRSLIKRCVESAGYDAAVAESAEEALERMRERLAAVAVCDINMPDRNGLWLAHEIRVRFPDTAVVMATGVCEVDAAVSSLRSGALDYLLKPLKLEAVREAVRRGVAWHHRAVEARSRGEALQTDLDAMLALLATCDPVAQAHAQRVARLSVNIALAMGITEPDLSRLEREALRHDVVAEPSGAIVAVAEAYDALVQPPGSQPPLTAADAIEKLRRSRSVLFDARVLEALSTLTGVGTL